MSMTPTEQIEALRKMASRSIANWITGGFALLAVGLAVAGALTRNPIYFMISIIAVTIAMSARQTKPQIHRAAQALDVGEKSPGTVQVTATEWSDSIAYYATIPNARSEIWRFEFIPLGWRPEAGAYKATVFRIPGIAWPALIQVEQGIIYPRSQPKLQADA